MSGKNVSFADKEISKRAFYNNKRPFKIDDIDVDKILVSKKESYGKKEKKSIKYFIGYDDNVIRPLCIKFPKRLTILNVLILIKTCL